MKQRGTIIAISAIAVIIISFAAIFVVVRVRAAAQPTWVPGMSAGTTPCQDFLAEKGEGVPTITLKNGTITEDMIRAYFAANPNVTKVDHVWYFDCTQRTFYYVDVEGDAFPVSVPPGVTLSSTTNEHEYVLFDAKTGNLLRFGFATAP